MDKKIVPIELFKQQVDDYFYNGDKYGFYFDYDIDNNTYVVYFLEHYINYDSGNLERTIKPIYYEN